MLCSRLREIVSARERKNGKVAAFSHSVQTVHVWPCTDRGSKAHSSIRREGTNRHTHTYRQRTLTAFQMISQ